MTMTSLAALGKVVGWWSLRTSRRVKRADTQQSWAEARGKREIKMLVSEAEKSRLRALSRFKGGDAI